MDFKEIKQGLHECAKEINSFKPKHLLTVRMGIGYPRTLKVIDIFHKLLDGQIEVLEEYTVHDLRDEPILYCVKFIGDVEYVKALADKAGLECEIK